MPGVVEPVERKSGAPAERLKPEQLYRRCDPTVFGFNTTDELPDTAITLGQDRALSAIQFGVGMRQRGYNFFALGPANVGGHAIVRGFLEKQATSEPTPSDWCYVHNFEQPHRPHAISLPAGRGAKFHDDMVRLVDDLRTAVSSALESEEYRLRHEQIDQELNQRRRAALKDLAARAADRGVTVAETPVGFAIGPGRDGRPLDPEEFSKLSEDERRSTKAALEEFEQELDKLLHQLPKWQRESREKDKALKRGLISVAVDTLIDDLASEYATEATVQSYLAQVKTDVVEHADDLRRGKGEPDGGLLEALIAGSGGDSDALGRYRVNVLVDHSGATGAGVVYEDRPTFQNLVGRIEHVAQMGTLVTHFTLIKPGALHRANGGYLILDARRLLLEPFAWEGLKRALRARALRIESLGEALSLVSTVSLDPEPIPLDVKVVLVGERLLYYLLYELDPDFKELFKVAVDFESRMDRTAENDTLYARLIGALVRRAALRPFTAAAVARVRRRATDSERYGSPRRLRR